ncbi:ABC transporter ATP-binding protein [Paracoccus liaowanqingii]|uniref:Spermidine/putrescine import ATP-binding protein PotA n=1 Tax=Paracoccus liaowanqingii TaxID=2560053 RepID=A0A4P7HLC4_9RHOB|nr:ABC transporter ATP-binding protein [Paracoccus liaowanqingii]QBX34955.1 ABC transporter ATP-binding protein [Paracoccus liaowanqingii]
MIQLKSVSKIYGAGAGAVTALSDVSLTVAENEFFTLLGPSGCGKTTLLRLLARFEVPSTGAIVLDGADIADLPPHRRPINTVFQNYALFPHMTVAQNIAFGLQSLGRPRAAVKARVAEMLALVAMEHLADRRIAAMSGGQQQRVALARALAPAPRILLLDEPLSALDLKLRRQMQMGLKRLQAETGITFVFVTHDQEEALTMSDRIAVMGAGRLQQVATPRDLYDRPANRFVAGFIGEGNFLPVHVHGHDGAQARVTIAGTDLALPTDALPPGELHAMIRPERICLSPSARGLPLAGIVENLVYLGTDTHLHLRLEGGAQITARIANGDPHLQGLTPGMPATLNVPPDALRLVPA